MSKRNSRNQMLDNLDFQAPILIEDQEDIKFNLYLRSREMRQIVTNLEKLMFKSKKERELFAAENRIFIESLMQSFVDDSNLSLEGVQLDQESAQLSVQLATDLRKSVSLINTLFHGVEGLAS